MDLMKLCEEHDTSYEKGRLDMQQYRYVPSMQYILGLPDNTQGTYYMYIDRCTVKCFCLQFWSGLSEMRHENVLGLVQHKYLAQWKGSRTVLSSFTLCEHLSLTTRLTTT